MTTDQLEDHLRSEFHRLDQRMTEESNLDLPGYVTSPPARSHRWVRVAAVASVAAAVVLLIPVLKPSDKPRVAKVASLILPGESPREAEERITRACMIEGGFTPVEIGGASFDGGPLIPVAGYAESPDPSARREVCHQRIVALGIIDPPTPDQLRAFYPHVVSFVDCLRANGFAIGTVLSEDEYVAGRGNIPISPALAAFEKADEVDPKYSECLATEITPHLSLLRT
jgi:hypothetical protein